MGRYLCPKSTFPSGHERFGSPECNGGRYAAFFPPVCTSLRDEGDWLKDWELLVDFPILSHFYLKAPFPTLHCFLWVWRICEFATRSSQYTDSGGSVKEFSSIPNSRELTVDSFCWHVFYKKDQFLLRPGTSLDTFYDLCKLQMLFRLVVEGLCSSQRPPVFSYSTLASAGSLHPHWGAVWEQPYWQSSLTELLLTQSRLLSDPATEAPSVERHTEMLEFMKSKHKDLYLNLKPKNWCIIILDFALCALYYRFTSCIGSSSRKTWAMTQKQKGKKKVINGTSKMNRDKKIGGSQALCNKPQHFTRRAPASLVFPPLHCLSFHPQRQGLL